MKRYIIVTKRGREVLTTSPTLITDYKVALQSLKKSVVTQLNKLNNLHLSLNDYLYGHEIYEYNIDEFSNDYCIISSNCLFYKDRIISIKEITIK